MIRLPFAATSMADRACLPVRAGRVLAAAALFLGGVLVGSHLPPLARPASGRAAGGAPPPAPPTGAAAAAVLRFPPALSRLRINVGPNHDPLTPPADDPAAGVLAVEAQLGVAAALRRRLGGAHPRRFFVIAAALAGEPHVGFRSLHVYNRRGESSSLAVAQRGRPWAAVGADRRPGGGVEFVPVLTLGRLLRAIPPSVAIPLLKIDTQVGGRGVRWAGVGWGGVGWGGVGRWGWALWRNRVGGWDEHWGGGLTRLRLPGCPFLSCMLYPSAATRFGTGSPSPASAPVPLLPPTFPQGFDLAIIKSADRSALRRVDRVMAEVYEDNKNYHLPDGVVNDLHAWVPHMARMGFALVNVSRPGGGEGDAFFDRIGDP